MSTQHRVTKEFTAANCPACKKPVTGILTFEVRLGEPEFLPTAEGHAASSEVTVKATPHILGAEFRHDCGPQAVR